MNYDNALSYSSQWLDIIKQEHFPEEAQAKWIIDESKRNFAEHFNRNWLEYRKSVTEAGDWASVEWSGKGATFTDVMGRKYIDWLGGFGMFDLGWCHPDVVEAVGGSIETQPHAITGIDRLVARCACQTDGRDHARRFEIFIVCRQWHGSD